MDDLLDELASHDDDVPVLAFNRALVRLCGDIDLFREIASAFLDGAAAGIARLQDALVAGDEHGVEREARILAGSAVAVSAERFRETALALKRAGRAGDLESANRLYVELASQFQRLADVLKGFDWNTLAP